MLKFLNLNRFQVSILMVLTTLSPTAHGSQIETSWMDIVFGQPEVNVQPAAPPSQPILQSTVAESTEPALADILPGFISSPNLGEWAKQPVYTGFGSVPGAPYLVSPFESPALVKMLWNPADPVFLPSTYFDNDPALKAQEKAAIEAVQKASEEAATEVGIAI